MKKQVKYNELWRQKRARLPVNSDADADWAQLNSLLDEHLPVDPSVNTGKPRFKGFKFLPSVFLAVAAAAMVYLALHLYGGQSHRRIAISQDETKTGLFADSRKTGAADLSSNKANKKRSSAGGDTLAGTTASGSEHVTSSDNTAATKEKYPTEKSNESGINGRNSEAAFHRANSSASKAVGGSGTSTGNKITGNAWKPVAGRNIRNTHGKLPNTGTGIAGEAKTTGRSSKLQAGSNHRNYPDKLLNANAGKTGRPAIDQGAKEGVIISDTKANHPGNTWSLTSLDVVSAGIDREDNSKAPFMLSPTLPAFRIDLSTGTQGKSAAGGKNKPKKAAKQIPVDWGISIGANSSGSFTPASQNHNFYGSLPVDLYPGLFATLVLNNNWGVNMEAQFFSAQTLHTTYTHANQSTADSSQALSIAASGKLYSLIVPVSLVYKTNSHFFIKGGPVISFPIKQTGLTNSFGPAAIKADSAYYAQTSATVNGTVFRQNINFGFSAGIGEQFNRWIFGVTYLRSLSGYTISSGFGNYKSYNSTLRFSIGFQLDKVKP